MRLRLSQGREAGFTLVEMLVALLIFALLAAAGVGLLRASVDTQGAVERRLGDLAAAARLRTLLSSDLAQAVDRPGRDAGGGTRPGFVGVAEELRLVRAGWSDPAGAGRPELQAVRWDAGGGILRRSALDALDGGRDGPAAVLARDLVRTAFRYRGPGGEWRTEWQPAQGEPALPAAVELTLERRGEAPVTLVLAMPQGSVPDVPPLGVSAA
ncbi:type II secretion system minor pseudopilin GspJ [uncultured Sphingomonas sp.]|uniref:type II secretion system minor pseudopilin GspJ n=1 Tax=uncultured Sphingomonas sp. TaxID=158754 RepID=UPI0025F0A562|nr:type II secretion system minor pseudopilin GspJ [uncultured Sphingomonas sp.]